MNKCNGNCHYLKLVWVGSWKNKCYCKAQKNMPEVEPWFGDCPYNILINEHPELREDNK